MRQQYCSVCGHGNPLEARFCMDCGSPLSSPGAPIQGYGAATERDVPDYQPRRGGTDWAAIAAALLAFLSLRHLSRRARNTTIVIAFLVLFFGCPMVCGFVMYVMEWFARLFG
jgi:hypothetical protein